MSIYNCPADIHDREKMTPVKITNPAGILKHWLGGSGSTEDQKEMKNKEEKDERGTK
jgi:hypothetical protein